MNDPWPKRLLRHLFYFSSQSIPTGYLARSQAIHVLPVLWHVVGPPRLPHLHHLYRYPNPDEFIGDLDFLLGQFVPIGLDDLDRAPSIAKAKKKPCLLLTFDDGLRQCKDVIAPILLDKGIPAVFFVNPAFIDNKELMFRHKASLILNRIPETSPVIRLEMATQMSCGPVHLNQNILDITFANRHMLDGLAGLMGLDFQGYLANERPYMTKNDIQDLAEQGFGIGAHSMDHPHFAQLIVEEQLRQARESIHWVKREIPGQGNCFAFPFTDHGITQQTIETIQGSCQWTFGCAGLKQERNHRHLQRLPMEIGRHRAREIVKGELLYHAAKRLFGRDKMKRE